MEKSGGNEIVVKMTHAWGDVDIPLFVSILFDKGDFFYTVDELESGKNSASQVKVSENWNLKIMATLNYFYI